LEALWSDLPAAVCSTLLLCGFLKDAFFKKKKSGTEKMRHGVMSTPSRGLQESGNAVRTGETVKGSLVQNGNVFRKPNAKPRV